MKLVGTVTLAIPGEDNKVVATTVDLGDTQPAVVQHALHQMLGQMVNMLPMIPGSTFIALSVTTE
jgi:hypothetical protein